MASDSVPITVAKRHKLLFNAPAPAAELARWGDRYREKGLLHDALEFYAVAGQDRAIQALCSQAVEAADLVLYLNGRRALGAEPDLAELARLQAAAKGLGKESIAQKAGLLLVK